MDVQLTLQGSIPLCNWIPFKTVDIDNKSYLQWLYLDSKKFTEPFFDETISSCRSHLYNSTRFKILSSLEFLREAEAEINHVPPTAFIFHISRCGSTAISQFLSTVSRHIVLSEVPLFDSLLQRRNREGAATSVDPKITRSAIALYCQRRSGEEEKSFIKTDSWHLFLWRQIRDLYPGVPFIILYRSPVEVLRSWNKFPGMQSVPGVLDPQLLGLDPMEVVTNDLDGYKGRVLERMLSTIIELVKHDNNILLVNFSDGVLNILEKISSFTSTTFTKKEMEVITERAKFHGKHPGQKFDESPADYQVPAYLATAMELYYDVEKIRLNMPSM